MDQNERRMIDDLFGKLRQAEQQAGPREREAEQQIAEALSRQPAAPYYMSQVILIQEQAMQSLNERVQQLEQALAERPASGGGFLGGLFGGGTSQSTPNARPAPGRTPAMPSGGQYGAPATASRGWSNQAQPAAGGGFMASAMQTAVGVAGGMLLANAIGGMFGEDAKAAEPPAPEPPPEQDEPMADDGEDFDTFGDF